MNTSILTGSVEGVLSRSEMKKIVAGSTPCQVYVQQSGGGGYWSACVSVQDAQHAYNFHNPDSGIAYEGGSYATGYCCASCGSGDFSNANGNCS